MKLKLPWSKPGEEERRKEQEARYRWVRAGVDTETSGRILSFWMVNVGRQLRNLKFHSPKAHAQKHQILCSSTVSLSMHYKGMSSV